MPAPQEGGGLEGEDSFSRPLSPIVILGLEPRIGRRVERPVRQGLSGGAPDPRVKPEGDENHLANRIRRPQNSERVWLQNTGGA